jgi:hypothetical protein
VRAAGRLTGLLIGGTVGLAGCGSQHHRDVDDWSAIHAQPITLTEKTNPGAEPLEPDATTRLNNVRYRDAAGNSEQSARLTEPPEDELLVRGFATLRGEIRALIDASGTIRVVQPNDAVLGWRVSTIDPPFVELQQQEKILRLQLKKPTSPSAETYASSRKLSGPMLSAQRRRAKPPRPALPGYPPLPGSDRLLYEFPMIDVAPPRPLTEAELIAAAENPVMEEPPSPPIDDDAPISNSEAALGP